MNAQLLDGTDGIVAKFADWVKSMSAEFAVVDTPQRAMELEQRIRSGGREILLALLQERLQTSIKRSQGKLRGNPCLPALSPVAAFHAANLDIPARFLHRRLARRWPDRHDPR